MRKSFIYIALAFLVTSSSGSCKKWLDVTPGNQVRAEDQFASEAGFRDALMGIYIKMTEPGSYGQMYNWGAADYMAQPYKLLIDQEYFTDIQKYRFKTTKGMVIVEAMWTSHYNCIANVNSALTNLEKSKGSINKISFSIIKGELLGLRAFLHFDLLRMFGRSNYAARPELASMPAIPYVTNFSKQVTAQLSYAETFALLEKDINEALELLKEDPVYKMQGRPVNYHDEVNRNGFFSNRSMRLNYYAAKALQARVFLWQGSTAKLAAAAAAAEEVINNSEARLLVPDAPTKDVILKSEYLFALNIERFFEIINGFLVLSTQSNTLSLTQDNFFDIYENNIGIGLSDFRMKEWFVDLGNTERTRVPIKMKQNTNDLVNRNKMPLIRLSEMYYIASEALMNVDLAKSIQLLNTVRQSRGIVQDIPLNANLTTVSAELTKEYRKDFIQEGQLFLYYKRKGFTSFPGLPTATPGNDGIYMLPYPDSEMEFGNRVQ